MPWLDQLRDATIVNLIQIEKSRFEPRETGFIRHEFGAGMGSGSPGRGWVAQGSSHLFPTDDSTRDRHTLETAWVVNNMG